jgi:hypothetical protein
MLQEAYEYAFQVVEKIIEASTLEYESKQREFSYNNYFKKPRCRVDYNQVVGILENDNLIADLLKKR